MRAGGYRLRDEESSAAYQANFHGLGSPKGHAQHEESPEEPHR